MKEAIINNSEFLFPNPEQNGQSVVVAVIETGISMILVIGNIVLLLLYFRNEIFRNSMSNRSISNIKVRTPHDKELEKIGKVHVVISFLIIPFLVRFFISLSDRPGFCIGCCCLLTIMACPHSLSILTLLFPNDNIIPLSVKEKKESLFSRHKKTKSKTKDSMTTSSTKSVSKHRRGLSSIFSHTIRAREESIHLNVSGCLMLLGVGLSMGLISFVLHFFASKDLEMLLSLRSRVILNIASFSLPLISSILFLVLRILLSPLLHASSAVLKIVAPPMAFFCVAWVSYVTMAPIVCFSLSILVLVFVIIKILTKQSGYSMPDGMIKAFAISTSSHKKKRREKSPK
eukprot:gnl/Carplike_NY0171/4005_a5418_376.p1 GENE.gnl/Carplike_NY0171/4005_a5418_376~~gnl/Carplike_NY0171/4005_a5418_376.p1  ORF type:complete len:383 (-),score=39.13 gnl/Carplike_NY0171/4005_a5418_376:250-1281(-)